MSDPTMIPRSDDATPSPAPDPTPGDAPTLASALKQSLQPGVPGTDTQPSGEAEQDAPAVHTFQVTHKIASPENPESHSLWTSAELAVDDAIAWIRKRLLES